MTDEPLLERVLRSTTLPSPPAVALRLLELFEDDTASLKTLGEQISRDPALAAKVMKVANSPAYRLGFDVTTLGQALRVLGLRPVMALCLSLSLYKGLSGKSRRGFDQALFWRRSILAATAGRALADLRHFALREEVFLASLLQDIGVLAVADVIPTQYGELYTRAGKDHLKLAALEREELGLDHAEVGARLLARWKLPAFIVEAVRWSHGQAEGVAQSYPLAGRMVIASGLIADVWLDEDHEAATQRAFEVGAEVLELSQGDALMAITAVQTAVPSANELFGTQLVDAKVLSSAADRARQALLAIYLGDRQRGAVSTTTTASSAVPTVALRPKA